MGLTVSVIVCAHNEARYPPACLYSLLAQTRSPDEILVIDNASTDETGALAQQIPNVRVVREPRKGLPVARETGRHAATGDVLVYVDADCRAPLTWLDCVERRFERDPGLIALSGPYRYYDWDWWGRLLFEDSANRLVRVGLDDGPVDGGAVEDCARHVVDEGVRSAHAASPQRAGRAPAAPLFGRRQP